MRILGFSVVLLVFLWAVFDKPSRYQVKEDFEAALGFELTDGFEVIEAYEEGLNDFTIRYEIQFNDDDFSMVLSKVDLSGWKKINNHAYSKDIYINKNESIYLSIWIPKRTLSYMFTIE